MLLDFVTEILLCSLAWFLHFLVEPSGDGELLRFQHLAVLLHCLASFSLRMVTTPRETSPMVLHYLL